MEGRLSPEASHTVEQVKENGARPSGTPGAKSLVR